MKILNQKVLLAFLAWHSFGWQSSVPSRKPGMEDSDSGEHPINNNLKTTNQSIGMRNNSCIAIQNESLVNQVVQEKSKLSLTTDKTKSSSQIDANVIRIREDRIANRSLKYPFSFYSIGTSVMISSVENLLTSFLKSHATKYFNFKNGDSSDILAALQFIPPFSKARLDILHPKIGIFVMKPEELFKKILKNQMIITKGDLDIETFKLVYSEIVQLYAKRRLAIKRGAQNASINLFSSLENQFKHKEILTNGSMHQNKSTDLYLNLTVERAYPSVEEIRLDCNQYFSVVISISDSSDLTILSIALEFNSIIQMKMNFDENFDRYDELFEIIKNQQLKSLGLFQGMSVKPNNHFDNFLIKLTTASLWSELEHLYLSNLSIEAIVHALKSPPPKLQRIEIRNYHPIININESLYVVPISSVKEFSFVLFNQIGQKRDIEALMQIFPNAEEANIYVWYELEAFEIKNNNLKRLQLSYRSMKGETEFLDQLFTLNLPSIAVKTYDGCATWKKDNDRIFYEFLFKNPAML